MCYDYTGGILLQVTISVVTTLKLDDDTKDDDSHQQTLCKPKHNYVRKYTRIKTINSQVTMEHKCN